MNIRKYHVDFTGKLSSANPARHLKAANINDRKWNLRAICRHWTTYRIFNIDVPKELYCNDLPSSDEELLLSMTGEEVVSLAMAAEASNVNTQIGRIENGCYFDSIGPGRVASPRNATGAVNIYTSQSRKCAEEIVFDNRGPNGGLIRRAAAEQHQTEHGLGPPSISRFVTLYRRSWRSNVVKIIPCNLNNMVAETNGQFCLDTNNHIVSILHSS